MVITHLPLWAKFTILILEKVTFAITKLKVRTHKGEAKALNIKDKRQFDYAIIFSLLGETDLQHSLHECKISHLQQVIRKTGQNGKRRAYNGQKKKILSKFFF